MLISVVIPIYNCEKYLEQCLDSVINQTYKNIEIILINDGSKDASGSICDQFAASDKRIVIRHKQNEGVVKAVIDGTELATGEKVVYIDSDDWVENDYIEKLVEISYNADIVVCDCIRYDKGKTKKIISSVLEEGLYDIDSLKEDYNIIFGNRIISNSRWGKIFNRDVALDSAKKCNPKFSMSEDLQFIIYYLMQSKNIYISHRFEKYYYRKTPNSLMTRYRKEKTFEHIEIYNEIYLCLKNSNPGWKYIDEEFSLARIEILANAVINEARNKNKKLRTENLKKIIDYYKINRLNDYKFEFPVKKIMLTYKVLRKQKLWLLKVFVSLVSIYAKFL